MIKVVTCPECNKKCYLTDRQDQCHWYCPNPTCRNPLVGFSGEPNMQHTVDAHYRNNL